MVFRRRFALRLAIRLWWLLVSAAAMAALLTILFAPIAALLAFAGSIAAAVALWRLVGEGNRELSRFVAALERSDLGQSFRGGGRGSGFDQLGAAYESALDRLRAERLEGANAARIAETLVDGTPIALLLIGQGDEVRFVNKAARRLFGRNEPATVDALQPFGRPFQTALRAAAPGPTALAHLIVDGLSQRVALDTTRAEIGGTAQRIVAIKIVQLELDSAELAAQIDLVRVLTHEVMNSLTPVTSLAETASRLIGGLDAADNADIGIAQVAVAALARRAAELERFVTSYKGFSDAPVLSRRAIDTVRWMRQLTELFAVTPAAQGVEISLEVTDALPLIDGDEALLTQVLLNLLKNAGEAAADRAPPRVKLTAAPAYDGRIKIVVADNGPGIPPALSREVFLPFYTTKPAGTGIGLSFARQIVMLHGGQIGVAADAGGCMELLLPTIAPR